MGNETTHPTAIPQLRAHDGLTADSRHHHYSDTHHHTTTPQGRTGQGRTGQHKVPAPTRERGPHTRTTPRHSTRPPNKQKGDATHQKGDADSKREGHRHSAHPSLTMPPHPITPPHHPRHPHPPPSRGGAVRGYPTTRTAQTDTHHHTPHTRQTHDTTAVLSQYALGVDGIGHTQWTRETSSITHHRHSTHHTDEDGHHPLTHSHYSCSHNQRTITINDDQQSMFNQQTLNNE